MGAGRVSQIQSQPEAMASSHEVTSQESDGPADGFAAHLFEGRLQTAHREDLGLVGILPELIRVSCDTLSQGLNEGRVQDVRGAGIQDGVKNEGERLSFSTPRRDGIAKIETSRIWIGRAIDLEGEEYACSTLNPAC